MSYRLPPLGAFRAFEAAARHLSFKLAAQELNVTPAAISQQIKALEQQLGAELFLRRTRSLALTDAARRMLPKVVEGFDALAAAVELCQSPQAPRALDILAPPSFAAWWLMPRLHRFTSEHGDIALRLTSMASMIDGAHSPPQPIEQSDRAEPGAALVAIRYGLGHYPGHQCQPIFTPVYLPACRPDLINPIHPLLEPADLRHYPLIHDETAPEAAERPSWVDWLREAGAGGVDGTRGPRFNDGGLAMQAAMDGLGVALALKQLVLHDVAAGRLFLPFRQSITARYAYFLVTPEAMAGHPAVLAFAAWLQQEVARDQAEGAAEPASR